MPIIFYLFSHGFFRTVQNKLHLHQYFFQISIFIFPVYNQLLYQMLLKFLYSNLILFISPYIIVSPSRSLIIFNLKYAFLDNLSKRIFKLIYRGNFFGKPGIQSNIQALLLIVQILF